MEDAWEWGKPKDIGRTKQQLDEADIVLCEWGLANAAWISNNLPVGKRLIVRVHAQETRPIARKFCQKIDMSNVQKVVFVAESVRQKALDLFGWPERKTAVIPNFVFEEEFAFAVRRDHRSLHLAMIGFIPRLKRLDRAIDLLSELILRGEDAHLWLKGPRPEAVSFMTGSGRIEEMAYFQMLFDRIERDQELRNRVHFEPWGNDVATWLRDKDVILSCSDSESFHYALAEGVLTGCFPIVWPWEDADAIYHKEWIVSDSTAAADRIQKFFGLSTDRREAALRANRQIVSSRYSSKVVYPLLDEIILGETTRGG